MGCRQPTPRRLAGTHDGRRILLNESCVCEDVLTLHLTTNHVVGHVEADPAPKKKNELYTDAGYTVKFVWEHEYKLTKGRKATRTVASVIHTVEPASP